MTETNVTAKIVQKLNSYSGCYARKHHSGRFSSGDPDISGVFLRKAFFIETKVTGGELTKLQAEQLDKWRKAGAFTALAIYNPPTKTLKVISLHDTETWDMFTGHAKLRELWHTSATMGTPFREYDFSAVLSTL